MKLIIIIIILIIIITIIIIIITIMIMENNGYIRGSVRKQYLLCRISDDILAGVAVLIS